MTDRWLVVGAALVLCGSLWGLSLRHRVEARNRGVEVLVESGTVEALAAGLPLAEVYARLRESGAVGVALTALTGQDLVDLGDARIQASERGYWLAVSGPRAVAAGNLGRAAGLETLGFTGAAMVQGEPALLRSLVVGFDERHASAAKAASLRVVVRVPNVPGAASGYSEAVLEAAKKAGAVGYLPAGDTAFGFRSQLEAVARALAARGMLYYAPEFAKIVGDEATARYAMPEVVRLHAAQQAEVDRMGPGAALERYVKAVRERNVRALLVRFADLSGDGALDRAAGFLRALRQRLGERGAVPKPARPFDDPGVPALAHLLVGVGGGLVAAWALLALLPRARAGALALPLLGAAAWLPAGREPAAFLAAVAAPVAAQALLYRPGLGAWAKIGLGLGLPLVGGLAAGSLLADLPHMLALEVFPGVKAAQALPILVAAVLAAGGWAGLRQVSGRPVTWASAGIAAAALGALVLMLARTGNDNPAAVSGLELQFRSLLDALLYTRPRTKEILLGHPALVLGCLLSARVPGSSWAASLLVLGAVGQTSIVNTMCHLHTPVQLSLARILVGVVFGGILGLAVWWLGGRLVLRRTKAA